MEEKNNDYPLVSIGIPTYNNKDGLKQVLDDITKQTYHNLEIIVSNNSSDNKDIEQIVLSYVKRDNRIHYYSQSENIGSGKNFQFVLNSSNGQYFMWASDDDRWPTNAIEEYLNVFMTNPHLHFVSSNVMRVSESGQLIDIINYDQYGVKKKNKYKIYMGAAFSMEYTYWIYGLFQRDYLKTIERDVTSEFGWDYMIIMREILNDSYGFLPISLFIYTYHQINTSIRYKSEQLGINYGYKWKWTYLMINSWKKIIKSKNLKLFDKIFSSTYLLRQLIWAFDNDYKSYYRK